ncbi:hypothetical protein BCON_0246g00160 [Botryotinia convoluta]|uniref:Uncharacterized protein n=1 Tax=Botryotinia convoluta TaxID=54673 RepID=A0A4Z1HTV2_9HELO|nr:hypothetical protein BCON_0246g00160 [Botryotinia convoluta]
MESKSHIYRTSVSTVATLQLSVRLSMAKSGRSTNHGKAFLQYSSTIEEMCRPLRLLMLRAQNPADQFEHGKPGDLECGTYLRTEAHSSLANTLLLIPIFLFIVDVSKGFGSGLMVSFTGILRS